MNVPKGYRIGEHGEIRRNSTKPNRRKKTRRLLHKQLKTYRSDELGAVTIPESE